jgi:hypothetical protein
LCNISILIAPNYFNSYHLRAQNYYLIGDVNSACEELNFIIENGDYLNRNRAINDKNVICK